MNKPVSLSLLYICRESTHNKWLDQFFYLPYTTTTRFPPKRSILFDFALWSQNPHHLFYIPLCNDKFPGKSTQLDNCWCIRDGSNVPPHKIWLRGRILCSVSWMLHGDQKRYNALTENVHNSKRYEAQCWHVLKTDRKSLKKIFSWRIMTLEK